ncbi:MAG: sigma 54-interacting transcriptional regulator [Thermoguttaceae bacterium]
MQSERASLILIENGVQKEVFHLSSNVVNTIGRATENAISFLDDQCSRYHAAIRFQSGQWFIDDLQSRNGTFLDGEMISVADTPLHSGSHIQVGHTVLQFACTEEHDYDKLETGIDDGGMLTGHSGIFGVSSDSLMKPEIDDGTNTEILQSQSHTAILRGDVSKDESAAIKSRNTASTRSGHGAVELCRLAYQLGKLEEVEQVAKLALEGLQSATGAEGVGLWLFPYSLKSSQSDSDVRLVYSVAPENNSYIPISGQLVRAVFEKKEAILFHEFPSLEKKSSRKITPADSKPTEVHGRTQKSVANKNIAAPVRFQNGMLGLVHLYTTQSTGYFDEFDLEYTLAVADTIGVALAHLNKQKELAANLNLVKKENSALREMLQVNNEIIGQSKQMELIHHLIARAAEGKTSLLVRGESGVGKELIARAVHFASSRRSKPLVCLNCASIPETLLASELFGHEKGSFTGATERKIGKFEAAHTGTLFLDEIGEMLPALQAKLLRILEGSSFERVGGNTQINVDVRVIAATNRDLEAEVSAGNFRHDLFFRLRVLEIIVPPLRKRPEDIPILAQHFLDKFSRETGRKYVGFTQEAMRVLMHYRWPGNVRELKNVIERAVVLGSDSFIHEQDLLLSTINTAGESGILQEDKDVFVPLSLDDIERSHILRTLEYLQWNKSLAAKQLGIERTTLDRKLKRYGIERD